MSSNKGPNAALGEPAPKRGEGVDPNHEHAAHLKVVDAERGILETDGRPWRKKIAVCGFASSTRPDILQRCANPEWEIWGLNQLYRHIPRADRWFDIHHNWDQETVPGTDYRSWAANCGIPFYMLQREPTVPTSITYPIGAVLALGADYYTSTIAYMTALAVFEIDMRVRRQMVQAVRAYAMDFCAASQKEEELPAMDVYATQRAAYAEYSIAVCGVDLTVGSEYFDEKPCAEFWLGQAVGRNICVEIPQASALCKQSGRYGYDPSRESLMTAAEVARHQASLRTERDEMLKRLYMLEGALECDERWKQVLELRSRGTKVEVA